MKRFGAVRAGAALAFGVFNAHSPSHGGDVIENKMLTSILVMVVVPPPLSSC